MANIGITLISDNNMLLNIFAAKCIFVDFLLMLKSRLCHDTGTGDRSEYTVLLD